MADQMPQGQESSLVRPRTPLETIQDLFFSRAEFMGYSPEETMALWNSAYEELDKEQSWESMGFTQEAPPEPPAPTKMGKVTRPHTFVPRTIDLFANPESTETLASIATAGVADYLGDLAETVKITGMLVGQNSVFSRQDVQAAMSQWRANILQDFPEAVEKYLNEIPEPGSEGAKKEGAGKIASRNLIQSASDFALIMGAIVPGKFATSRVLTKIPGVKKVPAAAGKLAGRVGRRMGKWERGASSVRAGAEKGGKPWSASPEDYMKAERAAAKAGQGVAKKAQKVLDDLRKAAQKEKGTTPKPRPTAPKPAAPPQASTPPPRYQSPVSTTSTGYRMRGVAEGVVPPIFLGGAAGFRRER